MTPEQREKRASVMRRSMALGHCVCDPRKPCPCDGLKRLDICECAGERPSAPPGPVRLTETVRKTGCSSKISKKDLQEALSGLPEIDDARVLVGRAAGDDAGIIRLSEETATVLTVDVFAPSVDDPYTFGQIAAANSVSDVYAMGGVPQVALSIIGFPIDTRPVGVMHEILRGGIDKMKEAGVCVIGGHSINDEEVKFGFAVVGHVPPDGFVRNSGAVAGDAVVLTKPLGVGLVTFANQIGRAPEGSMQAVAESMASLNRYASERMLVHEVHAATDVTGFGLLGHMAEIVKTSGVEVEIDFDRIPFFDGVRELARRDVLPGAVERNSESVDSVVLDLSALAPAQRACLYCPETSGGLLVFLPEDEAGAYVEELRAAGGPWLRSNQGAITVIGKVSGERPGGLIRVATSRAEEFAPIQPAPARKEEAPVLSPAEADASCCCAEEPLRGVGAPRPSASEAFGAYMKAVNAPGALDAKEKKLINLALSVLSKCEPCVKIQTRAAKRAGATDEEIAEAAALGISFGGASVNMFYQMLGQ